MILYKVFYQNIILIFYFDTYICSLLSRAKNPIVIGSSYASTVDSDLYQYEFLKSDAPPKSEYISGVRTPETQLRVPSKSKKKSSYTIASEFKAAPFLRRSEPTNSSTYTSFIQYELPRKQQSVDSGYGDVDVNYYWKVPGAFDDDLKDELREPHYQTTTEILERATKGSEPVQIFPNIDYNNQQENINRYETVGPSELPQDVYQFEPLGTSSLPENVYRYERIHFSPLYFDESDESKHSTTGQKFRLDKKVKTLLISTPMKIIEHFYSIESASSTFSQDKVVTPFRTNLFLKNIPSIETSTEKMETMSDFITDLTPGRTNLQDRTEVVSEENNAQTYKSSFTNIYEKQEQILDSSTTYRQDELATTNDNTPLETPFMHDQANRKQFKQFTPLLTHNTIAEIASKIAEKQLDRYTSVKSTNSAKTEKYQWMYGNTTPFIQKQWFTITSKTTFSDWNILWTLGSLGTREIENTKKAKLETTTKVKEKYLSDFIQKKKAQGDDSQDYESMKHTLSDDVKNLNVSQIISKLQERISSKATFEIYQISLPSPILLPGISNLFGKSNEKSTKDMNIAKAAYKTLWNPTKPRQKTTKHTMTQYEGSTKSSKTFLWNFNEKDAPWPNVKLTMPTINDTTKLTKQQKTLSTYFPFYHRSTVNALTPVYIQPTMPIKAFTKKTGGQTTTRNLQPRKSGKTNRCYECGLDDVEIPYYPTCYHLFSGANQYRKYKIVKYRKKCPSHNGCFKRFVDIGEVYNERGCRSDEPVEGRSYASKRLAKLEKVLHSIDEGCVTSPQASLTPFSRAISLFATYHACVCKSRYCNIAPSIHGSIFIVIFNICLSVWY